jgi:nucleoside-diphosphate-sugar epimerase
MVGGEIKYIGSRPAEVRETLADIQMTVNDLGWRPKFCLEEKINTY